MISNIDFLKRHSYSVKDMTEEDAEKFIIKQGTGKFAIFKYMKKRANFLLRRKAKNENKHNPSI